MIDKALKDKLMTYIVTAIAGSAYSSLARYAPNVTPPDVEKLTDPIILIDLDDVGNTQFDLGSRTVRKTGFITVTLIVKEGQGINLMSEFKGFMDTLGACVSNSVTYRPPEEIYSPVKFKGWEPTCIALPFQTEIYR